jgi:hypothetical protein
LVGEFFEVRAQVDRDLTTVCRVDRRLGLIKNPGRHSRYTPFRASGEAKTYIAPVPAYEGTLNNVWSLLATVNTALDDTSNTLCATQQQIFTLELQKRAVEAALQNREQPVVHDATKGCTSPSPKRPHYDSPDARIDAMPEDSA